MAGPGWADELRSQLAASARLLRQTAEQASLLADVAGLINQHLQDGRKILLCGNGGSAADAQHIATELMARYKRDRKALPALALGTDVSFVTAMSNDHGYERVLAREVEALGAAGDVLWAFSTSGNSPNVLAAVEQARSQELATIGFTGADGGRLHCLVDVSFRVPSKDTPRIQEVHMAVAHIICDLIEQAFSQAEEPAGA